MYHKQNTLQLGQWIIIGWQPLDQLKPQPIQSCIHMAMLSCGGTRK